MLDFEFLLARTFLALLILFAIASCNSEKEEAPVSADKTSKSELNDAFFNEQSYSMRDYYMEKVQDYTGAIELNPNDADVYLKRGNVKGKLKDYRGALQHANKAIELNPNDAFSYNFRGLAMYELGDKNSACLDFSKAGKLGNEMAYELIRDYCN